MFCQVSGNRILALRRTQREKGKVTTTSSQEMQNRSQPRKPRPVLLFLCRFDAAKKQRYKKSPLYLVIESEVGSGSDGQDKIFIFSMPRRGNSVDLLFFTR